MSAAQAPEKRARRKKTDAPSECCLDPFLHWSQTACLCSCHYPDTTAREMLAEKEST